MTIHNFIAQFYFYVAVDHCAEHQCQNNATCVMNHLGYTCACNSSKWIGDFCEQGKNRSILLTLVRILTWYRGLRFLYFFHFHPGNYRKKISQLNFTGSLIFIWLIAKFLCGRKKSRETKHQSTS